MLPYNGARAQRRRKTAPSTTFTARSNKLPLIIRSSCIFTIRNNTETRANKQKQKKTPPLSLLKDGSKKKSTTHAQKSFRACAQASLRQFAPTLCRGCGERHYFLSHPYLNKTRLLSHDWLVVCGDLLVDRLYG